MYLCICISMHIHVFVWIHVYAQIHAHTQNLVQMLVINKLLYVHFINFPTHYKSGNWREGFGPRHGARRRESDWCLVLLTLGQTEQRSLAGSFWQEQALSSSSALLSPRVQFSWLKWVRCGWGHCRYVQGGPGPAQTCCLRGPEISSKKTVELTSILTLPRCIFPNPSEVECFSIPRELSYVEGVPFSLVGLNEDHPHQQTQGQTLAHGWIWCGDVHRTMGYLPCYCTFSCMDKKVHLPPPVACVHWRLSAAGEGASSATVQCVCCGLLTGR